ncbi:ArsR/SmtB family transcription factor [Spiribacter halobius]|uniref:Transcriptional regulator n=1 Tax=Sediminicurvatus halobius TaxID=2182432 RepID=A0A2U2MYF9_9GAMM|nr:metalloregulator ArsR/SmtB family transcription factor [Spiribacter halobius]PWG61832.1 transcriptional regulator [Spiribacter halobius]UEX77675.1 metalloregulator ArsR/SmtB family transcription factor [Spiribacter halobius]
MTDRIEQSKALASDVRQSILRWLAEPARHFPHQSSGPPEEIGVCVTLLTEKLGMAQPTVSRHLELLRRAGFVRARKVGRWSYYQRDEAAVADYKDWLNDTL